MRTISGVAALALFGGLAACSGAGEDAPAPEQLDEAAEALAEDGEEAVSILRPDIEQPEAAEPELEPLNVVIGFPEGGSELSDEAVDALEGVVASPQIKLDQPIIVGGHSDAGGSGAVNERASLARAEAVRDWLIENRVAESRIRVIAFGEQNPVEPNALPNGEPNEEGRAANRRVEVRVQVPGGGEADTSAPHEGSGSEISDAG